MEFLRKASPLFAAIAAMHCTPASAQEFSLSNIQMHGFATIAAVATNTEIKDVAYDNADKSPSFDTDSRAALQFTMPVNKQLSFTLQMATKARNDWDFETEWAYGAYKINDEATIRFGRLRVPFFRISETLEVSYSYPWVRPPVDTYGQFLFTRLTGFDALLTYTVGDGDLTINPYYGTSSSTFELMGMEGSFDIKHFVGINFTYTIDDFSIRFGHTEGDYEVNGFDDLEPLTDIVYAFSGDRQMANLLRVKDRHGQFTGLGIDYDSGDFVTAFEYNQRKTDGMMPDNKSGYLMLGYRYNNLLTHVTYSAYSTDEDYSDLHALVPSIDLGMGDEVNDQVRGGITQLANFNNVNQESYTLGIRYDYGHNTAFKAEWQHVMPDKESSLLSPPFQGPGATYAGEDIEDIDVFTLSVDYIF